MVGRHVKLRKAGADLQGLCPFHNEKTPSFTVSPDKQLFHCFGCGAGGSIIRFLMDFDNLEFVFDSGVGSTVEYTDRSLVFFDRFLTEQFQFTFPIILCFVPGPVRTLHFSFLVMTVCVLFRSDL